MKEGQEEKKYLWDIILVALALLIPSISMCIDYFELFHPDKINWFSRSGSLVVLFAVMLEYRQQTLTIAPRVTDAFGKPAFRAGKEMSGPRMFFHRVALSFSVVGTLIWGYGDVPTVLSASW